jgi:hypothetical protein
MDAVIQPNGSWRGAIGEGRILNYRFVIGLLLA